jgi:hypothetical protein
LPTGPLPLVEAVARLRVAPELRAALGRLRVVLAVERLRLAVAPLLPELRELLARLALDFDALAVRLRPELAVRLRPELAVPLRPELAELLRVRDGRLDSAISDPPLSVGVVHPGGQPPAD